MVVGARQAGVDVSETADRPEFHTQPPVGFTENQQGIKENIASEQR